MPRKYIDLTGKKYGKLTVVERAESIRIPSGKMRSRWLCRCDCGNYKVVDVGNLKSGSAYSCGCERRTQDTAWRLPPPITVKSRLVIGRSYRVNGHNLKLTGLYDKFARFEDSRGLHECFLYVDLEGRI